MSDAKCPPLTPSRNSRNMTNIFVGFKQQRNWLSCPYLYNNPLYIEKVMHVEMFYVSELLKDYLKIDLSLGNIFLL